jgi:hypothetical protein
MFAYAADESSAKRLEIMPHKISYMLYTMLKKFSAIVFAFIFFNFESDCSAQNTFQMLYASGTGGKCFGSYQLADGGYIFTGIVTTTSDKIFITRTDCEGHVLWSKSYNDAGSWNNISQRVIPLRNGGFCLAASIGQFNAYNILIVKTDDNGNTIWQKVMNGAGDDIVNSVIETRNYDIVIAGHTNSFGQELGSQYNDVYVARIDSNGNYLWGKSIGTHLNIDQAFDVFETGDSMLISTGRYIEQGTFYTFILKQDGSGNVQFLKAYGDTNQYSAGYAIVESALGGYAITGATTVMKTNYQSYADEFLIRTNTTGDTLWTHTYHGMNPDGSENASSLIEIPTGFLVGVATMSYPTIGFVPNKHVVLRTDGTGNLVMAKSYNNGGSHYPYITNPRDGIGLLLSGFTTNYSAATFKPIIIRTDANYSSGCNETDLLSQTVMEYPPFQVRTPAYVVASGGSLINSTISANLMWTDSVICAMILDSCSNTTTGIERTATISSEKVFYNSASNEIIASGFTDSVDEMILYDYSGRVIEKQNHRNVITLHSIPAAGIYFSGIISGGRLRVFKIFIY